MCEIGRCLQWSIASAQKFNDLSRSGFLHNFLPAGLPSRPLTNEWIFVPFHAFPSPLSRVFLVNSDARAQPSRETTERPPETLGERGGIALTRCLLRPSAGPYSVSVEFDASADVRIVWLTTQL